MNNLSLYFKNVLLFFCLTTHLVHAEVFELISLENGQQVLDTSTQSLPMSEFDENYIARKISHLIYSEDFLQLTQVNSFGSVKRRLSDSRQFPNVAVGKLRGSVGECTASLIGESYILTAAHCFFGEGPDGRRSLLNAPYSFFVGYKNGTYMDSAYVSEIYSGFKSGLKAGPFDDWVIAKITKPLGKTYGVLPIVPSSKNFLKRNDNIDLIGYGGFYWNGEMQSSHTNCRARDLVLDQNYFLDDCDTSMGDSGSPKFKKINGKYQIVGLLTGEYRRKGDTKKYMTFEEYTVNNGNKSLYTDVFANAVEKMQQGRLPAQHKIMVPRGLKDQNYFFPKFINNCHEPITVQMVFENVPNQWKLSKKYIVGNLYDLVPNEGGYRIGTKNPKFYFRVESKTMKWDHDGAGSIKVNVKGTERSFRHKYMPNGRFGVHDVVVDCNQSI